MPQALEIIKKQIGEDEWDEPYYVNMGPQHPATHGVLRLFLELDGEYITHCDPIIGYLHRGIEKLGETFTYSQNIVLTDRLDYIASAANNVGYCLAVEKLMGLEVPRRAQILRVIVCEMARIASHLLWLATHALDIGAMTVFLYCFRDREWLLNIYEEICGARLTHTYPCIGGVRLDFTPHIIEELYKFTEEFPNRIPEYETLIDVNRIWLKRTKGVGVISGEKAVNLGLTGPSLRGSGVRYDLRKTVPYLIYDELDFEMAVEYEGDVYARYRVRMKEMRESNKIIRQCLDKLAECEGEPVIAENAPGLFMPFDKPKRPQAAPHPKKVYLIKGVEVPVVPEGDVYVATEVPKGELGFYLVSDGAGHPWRMRIRAPSFVHISAIPDLCKGQMVADIIAVIGSIDIVLGECDR
ncbi:NADH-quinone oxidoreductase subunit D [Thermodesulfatator autotrophicus]|uniref:NADH-quinone oxidoreductase subunit D n=1 Tax=Thermodesulfatator autotrophicus TaxID=1795632 RepID=A0A177E8I5_9BACT|nr:NADH-quinone oxidoreductase subunit D [Thermodesulfatator autotrophicus]OAG27730.1 NADH dehydrogenase [Thermodesulfatator autotrophicus]